MSDPITGAIAGSVTSAAIEKIVNYIEESEDSAGAWRRSTLEVAIQAEAFYRQEILTGRGYDPEKIEMELNKYGELAQQLAIRGELREFDDEFVELVQELGNALGEFADAPRGLGDDPTTDWDEIVQEPLENIKEQVDV